MIHLNSNNPKEYNRIKFSNSLCKKNSLVRWRIENLSTCCSFSVTTQDDFLEIVTASGYELKYTFQEHGAYDKFSFLNDINKMLPEGLVPIEGLVFELSVSMNDRGLLELKGTEDFSIVNASHRVRLLLGFYHSELPMKSVDKIVYMESIPYMCYGNILYLIARTDAVCLTNARGDEESISIAYKVNEILYNNFPIMGKLPGEWNVIQFNELQRLEFTLCDFMLEPIVLHSPLYLTIKIEEIEKYNIPQSLRYLSEI